MKKLSLVQGIVFFGLSSATALAAADVPAARGAGPSWEFSGSTNAYVLLEHQSDGEGTHSEVNLGTHAGYFICPHFEASARVGFTTTSGGDTGFTTTSTTVTVGPTYNFSEDAANSFFLTAEGGFGYYHFEQSGATYYPFAFLAGFGRRVAITEHVTWTPEFEFHGHVRANTDTRFLTAVTDYELRLFQFSVLF